MNEIKEKISVQEFVNKYNKLSSNELKDKLVESLIYRKYVPILEKKIRLQHMFDKSIMGVESNKYVDVFVNKMNVTFTILDMYTNLSFNKENNSEDNLFNDYDMLAENDLLNVILRKIPEHELASLLTINDQIAQTFYNKYKSTEAYVSSLVDRFATVFGGIVNVNSEAILEILKDEEKINNITNKFSKFDKIANIFKNELK